MSSIRLGDRLLIVGTSDISLIVALATKAGLTGRTCLVDESESAASRSAVVVEREGVLVECCSAPYSSMPFEPDSFDVVVIRNVVRGLAGDRAAGFTAEVNRVLRPGGRCLVIESEGRGGLARLFGGDPRSTDQLAARDLETALTSGGFRGVRTLAQREGLIFVEGVKANTPGQSRGAASPVPSP